MTSLQEEITNVNVITDHESLQSISTSTHSTNSTITNHLPSSSTSHLERSGTGSTSKPKRLIFSAAPTPNNTYLPSPIPEDQSRDKDYSNESFTEELLYSPDDFSISPSQPSLSPSHQPSSYSDHTSAHLLSSDYNSSLSSIPISSRPIPAPPLPLNETNGNSGTDLLSTPSTVGPKPTEDHLEAQTLRSTVRLKQEEVDAHRLRQLGYDAVLGRDYTFWSSLAISWLNIGCLQGTIFAVSGAYSYGGPLMIIIAWPLSGILSMCLTLTLSELASAYPVSGAMASWAWKCARGGVGGERGWGWLMTGFVLLVLWEVAEIVTGTMGLSFVYNPKDWQLLLFFLAALAICGTIQGTGWGRSHTFWLVSGAYGFTMWAVLVITLIVVIASRPSHASFRHMYFNDTGFSSKAYVYLLGWTYTTIASGADASAHMAEETKNPARNVPNAMSAAMALTYVLGYISIVLLLLAIDPKDGNAVHNHPFAFGYVLEQAVNRQAAISLCCLLIVALLLQIMAQLQASSRFVFALARDNALPFSEAIRRTNSAKQPVIANWVVVGLCAPFACLLIGSHNTLYSVVAVASSTLSYVGYTVPVILYLLSRLDLQQEGRTSWSLRGLSKPVAVVGVLFGLAVVVVQALPGSKPITADSISWSPVIFVGTLLICFLTWRFYGDKHYSGPIRALTKWQTGVELDLQSTLASRSRTSKPSEPTQPSATSESRFCEGETPDAAMKYPIQGYFPEHVPTVIVEPARTLEDHSFGTGTEWTDASMTDLEEDGEVSRGTVTSGGGRRSTIVRWTSMSVMPSVSEG
ncbi:hypothetical protein M231_01296 [Tremella mesenterica]|uniref:Amino acid/metabolite permease n=1 Tax=Tremella mesenterica TaxID=5217 RepID=A0A4Q1BTI7_TREME|nr:hypothetical protein M231_01296 [Tremella mesenterica]